MSLPGPGSTSLLSRKLIPAALLLVFALQCAWFIRTQSLTFDEPVHIAEGLNAWRHGRFEQYNDHPPLARLLCSLLLVNPKWQVEVQQLPESFWIPRISPDPVSIAWRARIMIVPLGVLLGVLLWATAARHVSVGGANFALVLFAFTPSLVAHFSLATTDGAATLLVFATAVQTERWRRNTSWGNTALMGAVLGLLLLAKFSTLPIFLVACAWLLAGGRGQASRWKSSKRAAAVALALFVLWAGYFFHISRLTIHNGVLTASHPHWDSVLVKPTKSRLNLDIPVPAGEYIAGFRDLVFHNAHGQRAFFLGEVSPRGGWKSYYPVTILLKWPTILLLTATIGLAVWLRKFRMSSTFWLFFSFPAIYLGMAVFSRFNIGERHIFPLYPFALLFSAMGGDWLCRKRGRAILAVGLLVLNAGDAIRYAPGYLSYMNIFVNRDTSYRMLSDSNLDWGQGLIAVRNYQRQHPDEQLSLAYFGSVDPAIYGIDAHHFEENDRPSGTVIVGATEFSGQYLQNSAAYRWLTNRPPDQVLDNCMYVYRLH